MTNIRSPNHLQVNSIPVHRDKDINVDIFKYVWHDMR